MSEQGIGHNSVTALAAEQLRSIVQRIENVETDIKALQDDRADIYSEAKGNGYDVKALRAVVRLRKQDANDLAEQEAILDTYKAALGMI